MSSQPCHNKKNQALNLDLAKYKSEVRKRSAYLHINSRFTCLSVIPKPTLSRILQCPALSHPFPAAAAGCAQVPEWALPPKPGSGSSGTMCPCWGWGRAVAHPPIPARSRRKTSVFSYLYWRVILSLQFPHTHKEL